MARDAMPPPWQTSRTRSLTKSQARSLLSMARLNSASFAATVGELQADPNRPFLFEFKRCLLTDEPSLVPGFANGSGATFHGWLP
jgi:hypothetical protein